MRRNQRLWKMLFNARALVIMAILLGALIGLGSFLATRSGAGNQPKSKDPGSHPNGLGGIASPRDPTAGMHLSFDATFPGSTLDTNVWSTCYFYVSSGSGCGHTSAYTENQWYLPSQDQVSGGVLHLTTSPTPASGAVAAQVPSNYPCVSGMITTDPSFSFTYGYAQFVARMPQGTNTWPALWMLPKDNSVYLPEIDLVEIIGSVTDQPAVAYHPSVGDQTRRVVQTSDLASGWHTFGLLWKPSSLIWYIDGRAVFTVTHNVPHQPMYLLANLAITDAFHPLQLPASCSSSLSLRSVQVWQSTQTS
jgi:beta-glucanase (GH16 family)